MDVKRKTPHDQIRLALFIDSTLISSLAKQQVLLLKRTLQLKDEQIAFFHVDKHVDELTKYRVISCPTLIRTDVDPPRSLVGVLSNMDLVLAFLNLERAG